MGAFRYLNWKPQFICDAESRLVEIAEITMPNRAFASAIAFVAGLTMSGFFNPLTAILGVMAIITTYCSQAIYNNIKDIEGDKVNAGWRPLASGSLDVRFAWTLMFALIVTGFGLAYLASPILAGIDCVAVALGIIYSKYTKSRGMLSYFTLVTTHMVIPLLSGYLIFGNMDAKLIIIIAFIYLTEVLAITIKDYKDVEGDRKMGMRTLPIMLSPEKASRFTFLGFCLPLVLSWVPWTALGLSPLFLVIYLCSGLARYKLGSKLLADPSPEEANKILKKYRYILMLQMVAWCLS
jgi:4-hydroxybenzoate polyprenyltransferase